jgi:polyisoprenoid-binding protein YceI
MSRRLPLLPFLFAVLARGEPVPSGEQNAPGSDPASEASTGPLPGQLELPGEDVGDPGSSDPGTSDPGSGDPGRGDPGSGEGGGTPVDEPPVPPTPIVATSSAVDSLLYVLVWRDPSAVANGLAHDHVVRATEWAGTFTFLPGDASACAMDVDVVTGALLNDEPALRAAVGLDSVMSERDRQSVRDSMLGPEQLDAAAHPTLSFTSTACRGDVDGAGQLQVDGTLTVHGVDKPVTWTVDSGVDADDRLVARGALTIAQSDFGITPYSAFFGAVRVADEVDLAFELTAVSQ